MTEQSPSAGELRAARVSGRIALIGLITLATVYLTQVVVRTLFFSGSNTVAVAGEMILLITWIGALLAAALTVISGLTWFVLWLIRKVS